MSIADFPKHSPQVIRVSRCRLCLSKELDFLFSLKPTPPAEWYFPEAYRHVAKECFPLDLFLCRNCFHVQLVNVLDSNTLFANYFYQSQTSPGLSSHFMNYASQVSNKLNLGLDSSIIDVGSNDGTLLRYFSELGFRVAGIEPSLGLVSECNRKGITTYHGFLDSHTVQQVISERGLIDLVTANNVFAHNDDLRGMAMCVKNLLKPGGFFVFEVSSLLHTMKRSVFDYIYHEHLSYHSLISLQPFLREFDLNIFDVEFIETKGGSYRVYAQRGNHSVQMSQSLKSQILIEESAGLTNSNFYKFEMGKIRHEKERLLSFLQNGDAGHNLVGYGASATTTTLTYEFDLVDKMSYLVDDNPIRHGCYLPGSNLQVHAPEYLESNRPTSVILLAWRFSDLIIPKIKAMNLPNLKIIKPLPTFEIINS